MNHSNDHPEREAHASRLYSHLAPAYKAIWPAVARRRIRQAVGELEIAPGAKVLEVGVGTGVALEFYPTHAEVTGVDLSEPMLAEAEKLIENRKWQHVQVRPMNAEDLTFEDKSFDVVTSFHTISVVSDPAKMMSEMVRVCRPGGTILIINHFRSENPMVSTFVDSASNFTKRLGWRTDLRLDKVLGGQSVQLARRYKTNPFSLFTIVKATREG